MNGNQGSSTGLPTNVGGTLAYVGIWVSGIVFLFIELKDRTVRFHAMQSTLTFVAIGILMAIVAMARAIAAFAGVAGVFSAEAVLTVVQSLIFAFSIVLWILLMIWTYQGRLVVVPVFGELAAWALDRIDRTGTYEGLTGIVSESRAHAARHARHVAAGEHTKAGRIAGSVAAIIWAIFLFVVFNFYADYIAYYHGVSTNGVNQLLRYPVLTSDLVRVLPILNIALLLTVVGHVVAIIFDRFVFRQVLEIALHLFGIAVAVAFLHVFPFDFSHLPLGNAVNALPTATVVLLVVIIVLLAIDIVVRIVRLVVHLVSGD